MEFIVIAALITVQTVIVLNKIDQIYKKLQGDTQQIKTSQRASQKRERIIVKKLGRPRKVVFNTKDLEI